MEESLYAVENVANTTRRWSPFRAFIFLFFAALGSWGLIALIVYLVLN